MGLYNRFCKRFFAAVIIRLTAQSDSRALQDGTRDWHPGHPSISSVEIVPVFSTFIENEFQPNSGRDSFPTIVGRKPAIDVEFQQ